MRYIDLNTLEALIPQHLKDAANNVYEELIAAPENQRTTVINANSHVWTNMKPYFENFFGCKCWYTESTNPGCDKDMDHFRPKNEVYEDPSHPGYWWLAFNWENYRFSCQFPNRLRKNPETEITGGKGTHFPLMEGSIRISEPNGDITAEEPMLLDPTVPTDPMLLWFDPDGKPTVIPTKSGDPRSVIRVNESIRRMNLDFPTFNDDRTKVYNRIKTLVKDGDLYYRKSGREKNRTAEIAFNNTVRDLWEMTDRKSPYSAAAKVYITGFSKEKNWVEEIVVYGP